MQGCLRRDVGLLPDLGLLPDAVMPKDVSIR